MRSLRKIPAPALRFFPLGEADCTTPSSVLLVGFVLRKKPVSSARVCFASEKIFFYISFPKFARTSKLRAGELVSTVKNKLRRSIFLLPREKQTLTGEVRLVLPRPRELAETLSSHPELNPCEAEANFPGYTLLFAAETNSRGQHLF